MLFRSPWHRGAHVSSIPQAFLAPINVWRLPESLVSRRQHFYVNGPIGRKEKRVTALYFPGHGGRILAVV